MSASRRKHVPMRTCIACHVKQPKRQLIRLVRTSAGSIEVDPMGKLPGRGAYVCLRESCWEGALQEGKLGRALKCPVSHDQIGELKALLVEVAAGRAGTKDKPEPA